MTHFPLDAVFKIAPADAGRRIEPQSPLPLDDSFEREFNRVQLSQSKYPADQADSAVGGAGTESADELNEDEHEAEASSVQAETTAAHRDKQNTSGETEESDAADEPAQQEEEQIVDVVEIAHDGDLATQTLPADETQTQQETATKLDGADQNSETSTSVNAGEQLDPVPAGTSSNADQRISSVATTSVDTEAPTAEPPTLAAKHASDVGPPQAQKGTETQPAAALEETDESAALPDQKLEKSQPEVSGQRGTKESVDFGELVKSDEPPAPDGRLQRIPRHSPRPQGTRQEEQHRKPHGVRFRPLPGLQSPSAAQVPLAENAVIELASAIAESDSGSPDGNQENKPNTTDSTSLRPSQNENAETRGVGQDRSILRGLGRLGSGEPSEDQRPVSVNRARFVQRVARAVQAAQERGGELRLRLAPPELGTVRLSVSVDRGELAARLEAETQATRQLLLDNVQMLRDRLSEMDIKIARFDVDLMDRQPENTEQHVPDDPQSPRDQNPRGSAGQRGHDEATTESISRSTDPSIQDGDVELDVVI